MNLEILLMLLNVCFPPQILGQACLPVSQLSVILLQLAKMALEPEIHFPLRLEAIQTFNSILESMSREQRSLIQHEQNQIQLLFQLAAAVLTAGDYQLQLSLSEALCRLTARRDREQKSVEWFSSHEVSRAFCDIRGADFEVDCRRFLNFVNGYHGDQSRVYTFACLRAFLGSTQLFCPKDEKLDSFWIDFNMGSECVSFFIDDPQGFLWESVHLLREEVNHYTIKVQQEEIVLKVKLNNPIILHNSRSQTVELSFSSKHHKDLEEAVGKVFQKGPSSPRTSEWGTDQAPPTTDKHRAHSYSRKRPSRKSKLKILPMSSPCSSEDSSPPKLMGQNRAEILFDQIKNSTFNGYLTGQTKGEPAHKKRTGPPQDEDHSHYAGLICPHAAVEHSSEGEELTESTFTNRVWSLDNQMQSVNEEPAEPESSGIKAAFKDFRDQLEQIFTSARQKAEAEVLQSLAECQQHVSPLLTTVHQHRMLFLQQCEGAISDELKHLEENTATLNSINSEILSFFQTEKQRIEGFCERLQKRLKSLDGRRASRLQSS
ncbi:uncharacterized protein LOC112136846 isoform X5 [Oryzias melastigma]|uniref:uncharacterized protein LOC112136846 isoform X5 n=1 Tax=Oryzias melastigma TaxID=30732 RepID=UPI000CF7C2B3|nr:uncharacterized protein LOC112136846 isoform X5 [Oryzias melastigma]